MVNDGHQEGHKDCHEPYQVDNGLLKVTVTALIFRKWHVDETSPSRSRWFFLDGLAVGAFGAIYYVRAWWEIPLDDLSLFEELNKIPLNSFLTMSSSKCTVESAEDFYLGDESQEQVESGSGLCLGMKAPTLKVVDLKEIESSLATSLSVFAP